MSQRTPIVGGNWKMNTSLTTGARLAEAVVNGCAGVSGCEVAIFPPFPYLHLIRELTEDSAVSLGAQDAYHEVEGAFTGEVSTSMLRDVGTKIVLAGHSERRHVMGEDDAVVNRKTRAILAAGLRVVLCIGETLEQREAGETDEVNRRQLDGSLAGVTADQLDQVVIAYEPVWAIGTGRTATPDDAQNAHAAIRSHLTRAYDHDRAAACRIQYGGSVKPANAEELITCPDVDGFLVGGASLDADSFVQIVKTVQNTAAAIGSAPAASTES